MSILKSVSSNNVQFNPRVLQGCKIGKVEDWRSVVLDECKIGSV